jgi:hypothetical protein
MAIYRLLVDNKVVTLAQGRAPILEGMTVKDLLIWLSYISPVLIDIAVVTIIYIALMLFSPLLAHLYLGYKVLGFAIAF